MPKVNFKLAIISLMFISSTVSILDTDWWKHTIIYEVYIPSFKDTNGDGLGDIKGMTEKLDHFVDLGIKTLYLSPFCKSPMTDFGYDVSDYTDVDPLFGTMHDFDQLIHNMKKRDEKGLKLIMDLVINRSSAEHPWFKKSIKRIEPYTDFYVWVDAKGFDEQGNPIVPSNWLSIFDGPAWKWNEKRGQFYLHKFNVNQPDFNLRSATLLKELKKISEFWIDRGVAGFRLDAAVHYVEDMHFRNEPILDPKDRPGTHEYHSLKHIYTRNLWESYEVIHELRNHIDQYISDEKKGKYERILIPEAYTDKNHTMAYYGTKNYPITHFPFNFVFVGLHDFKNASSYNENIQHWLKYMPRGATPNWVAENHDAPRLGSKLNEEYMDIVTITMMTLPGIACFYYGQEIGMMNGNVRIDQRQDTNVNPSSGQSRDGQRLPMQWDDTANAGFTSKSKPWLPVASNYWKVNVETQKSDKFSRYNLFKTLSQLRRLKTMKFGLFKSYIVSDWVYAFTRSLRRHEIYVTILNLGTETEMVDLHVAITHLPKTLEVVAASLNAGYVPGDQIQSRARFSNIFLMRPLSALVLSTKPNRKSSMLGAISTHDSAISTSSP